MADLIRDYKHLVLSFLQKYYKDASENYTWKKDVNETEIVIADKFATDLGVAVQRPSIILSRGPIGWSNTYRRKEVNRSEFFQYSGSEEVPYGSANKERNKKRKMLLSGGMNLNVVSKLGLDCEEIANEIFYIITGYEHLLKQKGFHDIRGLQMGEERKVRENVEQTLFAVSVSFSFISDRSVTLGERQWNNRVFIDDTEVYEGIDYKIGHNGTKVLFEDAPASGSEVTINYKDAVTLDMVTDEVLTSSADGSTTDYTLPDNGSIYGYYDALNAINYDISKK